MPGGWLHEARLVETHRISIPTDSVHSELAAHKVCELWARRWLEAHELDADLVGWNDVREGRTGVQWTITVGKAHSTEPGAGPEAYDGGPVAAAKDLINTMTAADLLTFIGADQRAAIEALQAEAYSRGWNDALAEHNEHTSGQAG